MVTETYAERRHFVATGRRPEFRPHRIKMDTITDRVVESAKGHFLTISGEERDEFGYWHKMPTTNYIREKNNVYQTRIFGRNVLSAGVSETMIELFENTPERTHSEVAHSLKRRTRPSWKK